MRPTIGTFLLGFISTLGFAQTIQATQNATSLPQEFYNSVESLISLIGGIVSSVLIAWLKHLWDNHQPPKNSIGLTPVN